MKLAPELKVAEVEEGDALKGEADEEMAVISSYLSKNEVVRSQHLTGTAWKNVSLIVET
jgi:hypothetical protein